MIQLVIFDMAGTAINEDNLVYKTIQASLAAHGCVVPLETVLLHGAGKAKRTAIADILNVVEGSLPSEERVAAIHDDFKKALDIAYDTNDMEVFPSVRKVIKQLKEEGIKVAFNTGYTKIIARKILTKVNIKEGEDIDLLVTADDVQEGRPAPAMIHLICEKLSVLPQYAIKIGDSGIDIEEGQNGGVKYSIGVTTGAQTRKMLNEKKPDFIFDDMLELIPLLAREKEVD